MRQGNQLNPISDFRVYKRNLPHYELPGSVYFITFRTTEGFTLSDEAKDIVLNSIEYHNDKKYKLSACVVMGDHVHTILQPLVTQALVPVKTKAQAPLPVPPIYEADPKRKENVTFYAFAQIMHSIKSYSANRIQRILNVKGRVWLDENYDRVIRDDKEFSEKFNYIVYDPVRARLVEEPEIYRWLYIESAQAETPVPPDSYLPSS